MSKIEELKKEATDLGVTFSPNIGEAKLTEKIEEFYKAQETPPVKIKEEVKEVTISAPRTMRARANEAEKLARVTHIITITDNDQRENHLTTTVSVNCTNDYFDLGTKRIPLNVPVEVEQGFINVLKEIIIPMHVINPSTGLTSTTRRSRYALSYEDDLKKD